MAKGITQEERQMVKLVEQLPLPEEEKAGWSERIRNGEMSEDLANEIREKITGLHEAEGDQAGQANRTRYLTELTMLVKRWRLARQSHNFARR
jgi:hypothetical protein